MPMAASLAGIAKGAQLVQSSDLIVGQETAPALSGNSALAWKGRNK